MHAGEHMTALGVHTNVTIVSTDEIDMSEEVHTDALYLLKYGRHLAPWHAFVNICGDNRRISAEAGRRVNEANKIRELAPRLTKVSRFTIVVSDPDLLLRSQFDATFTGNYVLQSPRPSTIPHVCCLHPCPSHTRHGVHTA